MNRPWIDPAMIARIMEPTPAASLRASAEIFTRHGRDFDAAFSLRMARDAERDPCLYRKWANDQAQRAGRLENAR